uniref:Uncharacterized protein n=1 Tax=Anguilla anguilla TaxID=7936 RepID=A0A0E9QIJ0_ANGAN
MGTPCLTFPLSALQYLSATGDAGILCLFVFRKRECLSRVFSNYNFWRCVSVLMRPLSCESG